LKIVLGTVQFGLKYGVADKKAKVKKQEVFSILELAYKKGIDTLDTAYVYGTSEERIGEFIAQNKRRFNIISKMPDLTNYNMSAIEDYCSRSLKKLKQPILYGYLVHRFDNILRHKRLWEKLELLKKKGMVKKIGVSLYNTEELDYLLANNIIFDIVQVPYSLFDQRFDKYLPVLKKKKIEIYARSIFLRGMCFLKEDDLVGEYGSIRGSMKRLLQLSKDLRIPLGSLCLCFVLLNNFIDKAIIGVDSERQLREDMDSVKYLNSVKDAYGQLKSLKLKDKDPILSYNWK